MVRKRSPTNRDAEPPRVDDLKRINGIGPGVEKRLNSVGIFTYAQLAALSPADIAAAVADLAGLSAERITKQDWIGQARSLAEGSMQTKAQVDVEASAVTQIVTITAPDEPPTPIEAPIYGKNRGSRSGHIVGEAEGTIIPTDTVTINVEGNTLPQGIYQDELVAEEF